MVLCLKKLELILYAVTGVGGGELEGLTGLRGRLTHKDRIRDGNKNNYNLTVKRNGREGAQKNLPNGTRRQKEKTAEEKQWTRLSSHLCPAAGKSMSLISCVHLCSCLETLD